MNQSIGRSIRHSKDYAMVFLLDKNFKLNFDKCSEWFKNNIIINKQENDIYHEQDRFFRDDLKEKRNKLFNNASESGKINKKMKILIISSVN